MDKLSILFNRYYNKTASQEELAELMQLIQETGTEELGRVIVNEGNELERPEHSMGKGQAGEVLRKILKPKVKKLIVSSLLRYSVAAAVILIIGTGIFLYNKSNQSELPQTKASIVQDASPGTYKAKLTLADGSVIFVDSSRNGKVASQGSTTILSQNGELIYKVESVNSQLLYNTISTGIGETFRLVLPDRSVLWLNAASSVSFPVVFPGSERRIKITGEVFIDVAKNSNQPFIVEVLNRKTGTGMQVTAMGTEFNVNAYEDEGAIVTTLVEGKIKVDYESLTDILSPSQQVKLYANGKIKKQTVKNIEEIVAWKEGDFYFENASLPEILRQLARWYNMEVVYENGQPGEHFFVIMKRNSKLSAILKAMESKKVKFRIEGKRLFVRVN